MAEEDMYQTATLLDIGPCHGIAEKNIREIKIQVEAFGT